MMAFQTSEKSFGIRYMVKVLVGSLSCTFGENMIGEKVTPITQYISDSLHNKFG